VISLLSIIRWVCGFVFALMVLQVLEGMAWLLKPEAANVNMGSFYAFVLVKMIVIVVTGFIFFWLRGVISRLNTKKNDSLSTDVTEKKSEISQATNEEIPSVKGSGWMSITAFVIAVICSRSWLEISHWSNSTKRGLWMMSIIALTLAVTSLQQRRKGNIFAGISVGACVITIFLLIGKL